MQKNAVIKKSFERNTDFTRSSWRMLFAGSLLHIFIVTFESRVFLSKPFEFYVLQCSLSQILLQKIQKKTLKHKILIHIARAQYHWILFTYMNWNEPLISRLRWGLKKEFSPPFSGCHGNTLAILPSHRKCRAQKVSQSTPHPQTRLPVLTKYHDRDYRIIEP